MELAFGIYKVPIVLAEMPEGEFGQFFFFPYPEIKVNSQLSEDVLTSTILHEALEMASEIYGLNLDESQIRTLEVSLMAIFAQNPWFVARLSQGSALPPRGAVDWPPSQSLPDSPEAL